MNNLSEDLKELLCVLEVPENSEITAEEKKPGFLDIAVNGTYFDTYDMTKNQMVHGNLNFANQNMQTKSYVTATIANPGLYCSNERYGPATVQCPAAANELEDAAQRARVSLQDADLVECSIMDKYYYEADYLTANSSLEELNFLGERLCSMDAVSRILFKGSVKIHGGQTATVKDYINMTYNLDQCQIVRDVTNFKELGEFFAEQNMVTELKDLQPEILELIDYTKIGKKVHAEKEGIFLPEGYFYDETKDFEMVYDGKTLPEQPKCASYLLYVKVAKATQPKLGVWIGFPQKPEQLRNVPKALGVEGWDDCKVLGVQSILQDMQISINQKEIENLNTLAQNIIDLGRAEQMKFKALLEISGHHTIDAVQKLLGQLDKYQLYDDLVSTNDYAQQQLESEMNIKLPEELVEFIDFDEYYKYYMENAHVEITEYGLIERIDDKMELETVQKNGMDGLS